MRGGAAPPGERHLVRRSCRIRCRSKGEVLLWVGRRGELRNPGPPSFAVLYSLFRQTPVPAENLRLLYRVRVVPTVILGRFPCLSRCGFTRTGVRKMSAQIPAMQAGQRAFGYGAVVACGTACGCPAPQTDCTGDRFPWAENPCRFFLPCARQGKARPEKRADWTVPVCRGTLRSFLFCPEWRT